MHTSVVINKAIVYEDRGSDCPLLKLRQRHVIACARCECTGKAAICRVGQIRVYTLYMCIW